MNIIYNMKNGYLEKANAPFVFQNKKSVIFLCSNMINCSKSNLNKISLYNKVIYNKQNGELFITTDAFSGLFFTYYTVKDNYFYLSTSLKELLLISSIERIFDQQSIEDFLSKGIIIGNKTLIKGINKLTPGFGLKVKLHKIYQISQRKNIKKVSEDYAKKNWNKILKKSILDSIADIPECEKTAIALSSGYDTNYIFNYLRRISEKFSVFSVGGSKGRNEVPCVKSIMQNYPQFKLYTSTVDHKTFQNFPDIVWRLEGSIYEGGIFLQYVLAKALKLNRKKYFICGEGADQIFNEKFYSLQETTTDDSFSCRSHPREMLMYCILKKSSIILNSFGIKGRYPYLSKKIQEIAFALRRLNETEKIYHKQQCRKIIPAIVTKHLQKIGGATHYIALFDHLNNKKNILRYLFYLMGNFKPSFGRLFYDTIKIMLNVIKQKIRKRDERIPYTDLIFEKLIDSYLKRIYLRIFEKLFINDKYNEQFRYAGINVKLDELLS